MLDSGRHLLELIDDVLDATRLDLGAARARREPVAVGELVRAVAGQMAAEAGRRGIAIACAAEDDEIEADPRLLRQALFNVIANAVKFSPDGAAVQIEGRRAPDGAYALSVLDAGPGIPEGQRARVLQPFQQADDSLARRHEGLGLGLHVVRTVVEGHGGRVEIADAPGGGAAVGFVLPAAARDAD